jgi:hypothetical protein
MSKQTLFIIISTVIIVIGSLGLVLNNQLNKMANGFGIPDLDSYNLTSNSDSNGGSSQATPGSAYPPGTVNPDSEYSPPDSLNPLSPEQARIAAEIEARVNQPVNRKDLIKAGLILVGSLSREDLNYVYQVGRKPQPSKEEMIKVREILVTNLAPEDIATLQTMGEKYGKNLRILDPGSPIR